MEQTPKPPLTPSEMGKLRWKGVSKKDRRAHALKAVAERERKRAERKEKENAKAD